MCGRYVDPNESALERFWLHGARGRQWWDKPYEPRYNVAPTMPVAAVFVADDGVQELTRLRWGMVPHWWRKPTLPSLSFNARSEEAAEKPMWRESLARQRCLMPARGWYEWCEHQKALGPSGKPCNQPYFLFCPDEPDIAFAGLWSAWAREDGSVLLSCALLSKEAAPAIAGIHHRMPVVLPREHFDDWLDPSNGTAQALELIETAKGDLDGYPVSTRVNSARNDEEGLIAEERLVCKVNRG